MGNPADLIPNFTAFIQLGLFFIAYAFLHFFVFIPYMNLLDARKAKTTGLKEKSIHEREQAEKYRADYEAFMKAERRKVATWADEERKKISDEERAIIATARDKVSAELKQTRDQINSEVEKARKDLAPLASEYSSQIVSKLLGRKVTVSASSLGAAKRSTAETTV